MTEEVSSVEVEVPYSITLVGSDESMSPVKHCLLFL